MKHCTLKICILERRKKSADGYEWEMPVAFNSFILLPRDPVPIQRFSEVLWGREILLKTAMPLSARSFFGNRAERFKPLKRGQEVTEFPVDKLCESKCDERKDGKKKKKDSEWGFDKKALKTLLPNPLSYSKTKIFCARVSPPEPSRRTAVLIQRNIDIRKAPSERTI